MTKLTDAKNTKKDFVEAYNKQLKEIEDLKSQLADPQLIVEQKKTEQTLKIANEVVNGDINSVLKNLHDQVALALTSLTEKVTSGSEQLVSLEEAIKLKKGELNELFDIEAEAYSLTSLINANKLERENFAQEKKDIIIKLDQDKKDLEEKINSLKLTLEDGLNAIEVEIAAKKKKELAEWKYELERTKIVDNDKWEDTKRVRERELSDREDAVEKREDEVSIREEKIEDLEARVAEIPSLVKTAEEEGKKAGKAEAEKSFVFERRAIEAKANSDKTILENRVESLEEDKKNSRLEIEKLQADLKEAYSKLQATATAAVEAQANANARMVSGIEQTAREVAGKSLK